MTTTTSEDGRLVTIDSFEDDGLSSGPRKIQIYLPADYHAGDALYPVIYFADGGAVFSANRPDMLVVDKVLDTMVEDGSVVPAIIVAIFNSNPGTAIDGRVKDLSPFVDSGYRGHAVGVGGVGGGLDGFYRMITERLKSHIDTEYRTKPEPASTGIAGISLGGLAAFTMAYDHPETFGIAACMSSSFWSADESTIKRVAADSGKPKTAVRFWLDGGFGEYGVWRQAARVYELLEHRGWTAGIDLAGYFDYTGRHDWPSFSGRVRNVLQFMLGKERPALTGYRLVQAVEPTATVMDLRSRRRTVVGAEAIYSDGTRLTVPDPLILVDDPAIVSVDQVDPIVLHAVGAGETVIRSTYGGLDASLPVIGYDPADRSYLDCPFVRGEVDNRPFEIMDGDNLAGRFAVTHDEESVTIDVRVFDDHVVAVADTMPWDQTYVEIALDARPEDVLRKECGYDATHDFEYLILIHMSPGESADPIAIESLGLRFERGTAEWDKVMPKGAKLTCQLEPGGYRATMSVPVGYLNERQGGDWRVVRVNVSMQFVGEDGALRDADWCPGWSKLSAPLGSGIFRRST